MNIFSPSLGTGVKVEADCLDKNKWSQCPAHPSPPLGQREQGWGVQPTLLYSDTSFTPTSHSYLSQSLTTSHSLSQPLNTSHNLSQPITTSHYLSQPLVTSHILSQPLDSPLTKGLGTQYTHIYHLLPNSTIQSQCGNGGDYFLHIQNYNNKHRPPHDLLSAFWALLTCY